MNKDKITAIITSGGNSTRFGSNKLIAKIKNKTSVINLTISKFIDIVDEIIIPAQDEVKNHILSSGIDCKKIKFALPGSSRQKSVYNALKLCSDDGIILIHDGARPYIDKDIILKTISLTKEKKATVVGNIALDTIKEINNGKIVKTLNRNKIFQARTPQAFEASLIKKIHEKLKDRDDFTDDSSMAETLGIEVFYLEGNKNNIKITTKEDLS